MKTPGQDAGHLSDDILLRAVAGGDEAAFRVLYRRHTPRLRALAGRLLGGHPADTEDVLQETWVRAIGRIASRSGGSSLGTWLSGISINVAWELIRRQRPGVAAELREEASVAPPDTIERIDLESALQRLPDAQRIVVVLHDVEGYTHPEIAKQLGVAVGTSKSHLFRARRALRAMLESYERISE